MAYCNKCGNNLQEGQRYCDCCGHVQEAPAPYSTQSTPIQPVPIQPAPVSYVYQPISQAPIDSGPWKAFAIMGFVFGLTGFIMTLLSILPFFYILGSALTEAGLVFSILGKRSITKHGMATTGMVFSIIGIAFTVLFGIYCAVAFESLYYLDYYDLYASIMF